jgi:hypothetical protein
MWRRRTCLSKVKGGCRSRDAGMPQRGHVHRDRVQAEVGGMNVFSSDLYLLGVMLDNVTWPGLQEGLLQAEPTDSNGFILRKDM